MKFVDETRMPETAHQFVTQLGWGSEIALKSQGSTGFPVFRAFQDTQQARSNLIVVRVYENPEATPIDIGEVLGPHSDAVSYFALNPCPEVVEAPNRYRAAVQEIDDLICKYYQNQTNTFA